MSGCTGILLFGESIKNNFIAVVAPTVNEDSDDGYSVGSKWIDTAADKVYQCVDSTVGAAVWIETTATGAGDLLADGSVPLTADWDVGNFNITATKFTTDSVQFDIAAGISVAQGQMAWNADEETLDIGLNGAVLQTGQETHYHARNNTGSLIPDGTAVMATGTLGASGRITIGLMVGATITNAKFFLGITTEDIADGTDGKVTSFGKVRDIDTSSWNDGDVLWVDNASDGDLTNVEPTSGSRLPIAFVVYSHATNGTIAVRATDGTYLAEAHDTQIASEATGEVLQYNGTAWVNAQVGLAFIADVDTQITPTVPIVLDHASNNEAALTLNYTTNKVAGDDYGLVVDRIADTSSPGSSFLFDLRDVGVSKFSVDVTGTSIASEYHVNDLNTKVGENGSQITLQGAAGAQFNVGGATAITDVFRFRHLGAGLNASSGVQNFASFAPIYNQSATAGGTDALINRTVTAIGSGPQRYLDMQTGDVTASYFDAVAGQLVLDDALVYGATTGVAFGDGDTIIYEAADDSISWDFAGGAKYAFSGTAIRSSNSFSFELQQAVGSSIDPIYAFRDDNDTGTGRAAADQLTLTAGAVEGIRLSEASSHIIRTDEAHTGITAFATGGQASAVELLSSVNIITTCATNGDSTKLPVAVIGVIIEVHNLGVAIMDLFPDAGGSIEGGAVNAAISIGVGGSIRFRKVDGTDWRQV